MTELLLALAWLPLWLPVLGNVIACCCGGDSCTICTDSFGRGDSSDIDTGSSCGWTELSGAFDITSAELRCTSAGIALCDTAHPDSEIACAVRVDIKHSTSASSCDVIVGYASSSDYYYARFIFGSNAIQIRHYNGSTHTTITSTSATLNTNTFYTAVVCVVKTGAIIVGVPGTSFRSDPQPITGFQVGLGANGSGTATFDAFEFYKVRTEANPDCPTCDVAHCAGCQFGTMPVAWDVTFDSNLASGTCTNCSMYHNQTFRVELCACKSISGTTHARWATLIPACNASCHVPENLHGVVVGSLSGLSDSFFASLGGVYYVGTTIPCSLQCSQSWGYSDTAAPDCSATQVLSATTATSPLCVHGSGTVTCVPVY